MGPIESSDRYHQLSEDQRLLLAPERPHDELGFQALADTYNFRLTSDRRRLFTRLLIEECVRRREAGSEPIRVLDIGCGRGFDRQVKWTHLLRPWVDDFWGIEPDESVEPEPGLFDHYQHALMEDADLPEDHFDIAFSFLVMEHVENPESYLRAVARCLKPGGVHMFLTPNARHYFAIITRTLRALRLDELVLRMIQGKLVEEYHYPVRYRCNTRRDIARASAAAGMPETSVAYVEAIGPKGYLKGPLELIYHTLQWKRTVIKRRNLLLTLIARSVRAQSDAPSR